MQIPSTKRLSKLTVEELIDYICDHGLRDVCGLLWQYNERKFRRFVSMRTPDDVASDIVQTVGKELYTSFSRQTVERFPKSAFKIARDRIVDYYRKADRDSVCESLTDWLTEPIDFLNAGRPDRELWLSVTQQMNQSNVNKEQQEAVLLHYLLEYTIEEIAHITGVKLETVRSRLRYARQKLGVALQEVVCLT